jgi:hypothetical protein
MKCERMNYIAHGQTKSITLQKEREGEEEKNVARLAPRQTKKA